MIEDNKNTVKNVSCLSIHSLRNGEFIGDIVAISSLYFKWNSLYILAISERIRFRKKKTNLILNTAVSRLIFYK